MANTDVEASQHTIELGTGRFDWPRYERVHHRFGLLMFSATGKDGKSEWLVFDRRLDRRRGVLSAQVVTRRDTYSPEAAIAAGTTHQLGRGTLHVEQETFGDRWEETVLVGIEPDGLAEDAAWMDADLLYGLHDSTVSLTFTPDL
jgi:hypothetical protein